MLYRLRVRVCVSLWNEPKFNALQRTVAWANHQLLRANWHLLTCCAPGRSSCRYGLVERRQQTVLCTDETNYKLAHIKCMHQCVYMLVCVLRWTLSNTTTFFFKLIWLYHRAQYAFLQHFPYIFNNDRVYSTSLHRRYLLFANTEWTLNLNFDWKQISFCFVARC